MRALTFWKRVIRDRSDMLTDLLDRLDQAEIQYCVIGGQAVNAYVTPLVSLDLDMVVAAHQVQQLTSLFEKGFIVEKLAHSLNISRYGSDLRVQIKLDPRYFDFISRATHKRVLGLELPVAYVEDVLQSKIWALEDPEKRGSKRLKDLMDIARLIEAYPALHNQLPKSVKTLQCYYLSD